MTAKHMFPRDPVPNPQEELRGLVIDPFFAVPDGSIGAVVRHDPAPAENLEGPWGNRDVAPGRNDVDDRTTINFPGRYVEGAGEAAEQREQDHKIRG